MSGILEALESQRGQEQLSQEISSFMFDLLNLPLPTSQQERFQYPKCPFCKGRPRLVPVKGAEIQIRVRAGSPVTLEIPKYRVETCCSASYKTKHEGLSRQQLVRLTAQVEAQRVQARGKK
jgi:hypothetical protein